MTLERIARGCYGSVYFNSENPDVLTKVIEFSRRSVTEETAERAVNNNQAVMENPNRYYAAIYSVVVEEDRIVMEMENLSTQGFVTVMDYIRNNSSERRNMESMLYDFMDRLNEAGIYHEDFHEENVMYNPDTNEFRLIDSDAIILNSDSRLTDLDEMNIF